MKLKSLILIVLLLASLALVATTKTITSHQGIIRKTAHSLWLETPERSHLLLLTAGVIRDSVWVPVEGSEASIEAWMNPETGNLEVISITDTAGTVAIRNQEFQALHPATSKIQVTASTCIGCRLCERNCPVDAISMVGRKAVIDPEKCVECGVCIGGVNRFRGCPVGAIKKTEE